MPTPSKFNVSFSVLVTVTVYPKSSVRCFARYGPTKPPPPIINAFI